MKYTLVQAAAKDNNCAFDRILRYTQITISSNNSKASAKVCDAQKHFICQSSSWFHLRREFRAIVKILIDCSTD